MVGGVWEELRLVMREAWALPEVILFSSPVWGSCWPRSFLPGL